MGRQPATRDCSSALFLGMLLHIQIFLRGRTKKGGLETFMFFRIFSLVRSESVRKALVRFHDSIKDTLFSERQNAQLVFAASTPYETRSAFTINDEKSMGGTRNWTGTQTALMFWRYKREAGTVHTTQFLVDLDFFFRLYMVFTSEHTLALK